jgi:geranylgeranyl pyrophosphate synthase
MIPSSLPPLLREDLQQVARIIDERTTPRRAVILLAGADLIDPPDQLRRAALVLATAQLGSPQHDDLLHAAAAAELMHAALRAHDALVDERRRRQAAPVGGAWEHGVELMVGDYLFALAAGELALHSDARVIGYFSEAVMRVSEGRLMPVAALEQPQTGLLQYWQHVTATAAALPAAAGRAGAACAGFDDVTINAAGQFAELIGLCWHIAADVALFDRPDDAAAVTALRNGRLPLPLFMAGRPLPSLTADAADAEVAALLQVGRNGLPAARAELERLRAEARAVLATLPGAAQHTVLEQLMMT